MKFSLFLLVAAVLCSAQANVDLDVEWTAFKLKHSKQYASPLEESMRLAIWKAHLAFVQKHNEEYKQGKHTFFVGINRFADLTNKEFVAIYNGFNATRTASQAPATRPVFHARVSAQVPDSIDWRTQGYVTPVKDQGQCGSCWSFSATGSLEGQHFAKTGQLVSLSEQNLVDCSGSFGNQGCNGGLMDQAFSYIKANNGIDTEESYPYTAQDGDCQFDAANVGATDTGFVDIKSKDEEALRQAVGSIGPVSVAIDAGHTSFQLYQGGIYHEFLCSQTRLDHGVLAVGYGSEGQNKDYWIVKNSWAETWGDKGYIKMSRNRNNNCGIATSASYPLV